MSNDTMCSDKTQAVESGDEGVPKTRSLHDMTLSSPAHPGSRDQGDLEAEYLEILYEEEW